MSSEPLMRAMSAAIMALQSEFPGTICQLIVAETPSGAAEGTAFTITPNDLYMVTTGMDSNETALLECALDRVVCQRAADTVLIPPRGDA